MCQQQKNCSSATLATLHLLLRYPGSTRNRRTCRLGLFRLLLFLLSLGLCDGRNSLLVADSSGLVAPGSDSGKVSTNDTTLVLYSPAGTLLSDFLGDTLLVHAAIDLCPCDLTWVLALEEQGRVLGTSESENFGVSTDKEFALGGVHTETGERVDFDLHLDGIAGAC